MDLDFLVTLCVSGINSNQSAVSIHVNDEEWDLLKDCCRVGGNIDCFEGLENLYVRICAKALGEGVFLLSEENDSSPYCAVSIPHAIYEEVDAEAYPLDNIV